MSSSIPDSELLARLLSKDEKALRYFYDMHKNSLLAFILRNLQQQDAEEVLQDTFVACIESLRNFRGQSSLKTFLYSIAKRKIIDKLRRQKIKRVLFSYLPDYILESLAVVFLHDTLDNAYLTKKIQKVFSTLPNDYESALKLKYIEGYSVADIAAEKRMTYKAVESLLFRARKAFVVLYTHYDRQGILPFEETI